MNTSVLNHSLHNYGFVINDVFDLIRMPKETLPDELEALATKYCIDPDCTVMFYQLAKRRLTVKYNDNLKRQQEINKLYELKTSFESDAFHNSPIKRIEIYFFSGDPVVISNKLLLDNFYIQMQAHLNNFIATYIQKSYKPIAAKKRNGLQPANKQLALKMLRYFEVKHPELLDKEVGNTIREIFAAAKNKLPYSDDKDFIQKLKKLRATKSAEMVKK